MNKKTLLGCLLALFAALSCGNSAQAPKKENGEQVKHADAPGYLDLKEFIKDPQGVDADEVKNAILLYLLAASKSNPFAPEYAALNAHDHAGLPPKVQESMKIVLKYLRTGGQEAVESLQSHVKTCVQQQQLLSVLPGKLFSQGHSVRSYQKPIHVYCEYLRYATGKSLVNMFTTRTREKTRSDGTKKTTTIPLENLVHFVVPPALIKLSLYCPSTTIKAEDIKVSRELVLPAACTPQEKDTQYQLLGASNDKVVYFRWSGQWYKIDFTGSDYKPTKVNESEVKETGKKESIQGQGQNSTTYQITQFEYFYERQEAAAPAA